MRSDAAPAAASLLAIRLLAGRLQFIPAVQNDRDNTRASRRRDDGPPKPIRNRFELAAPRLMREWLDAGEVRVSAGDFAFAREFLEQVGWQVQLVPGLLVRLVGVDGHAREMTREKLVMQALRELARSR